MTYRNDRDTESAGFLLPNRSDNRLERTWEKLLQACRNGLHDERRDTCTPPGILLADHFVRLAGYHSYRSAGTRDWLMT